jgi:hypothetical protein
VSIARGDVCACSWAPPPPHTSPTFGLCGLWLMPCRFWRGPLAFAPSAVVLPPPPRRPLSRFSFHCLDFNPRDDVVEEEEAAPAEVDAEGEAGDAPATEEEEWDVFHDDSGTPFFTNRVTGESVWDKPEQFREWEELLHAESGLPYYFNRITNETVWERPATFEKVRAAVPQP